MIDKTDYEYINRLDSNNQAERERLLSSPNEKVEVYIFIYPSNTITHIFDVDILLSLLLLLLLF